MRIFLFKGTSFISRLIRFQTRSEYSHAAVELDNKSVVEAWKKGVTISNRYWEHHKPYTEISVFDVEAEYNKNAVESFLKHQVGHAYDYLSVLRFVTRRKVRADDKWFCSELVAAAFHAGGLELLKGPPSLLSPRDIYLSPFLKFSETIVVS